MKIEPWTNFCSSMPTSEPKVTTSATTTTVETNLRAVGSANHCMM